MNKLLNANEKGLEKSIFPKTLIIYYSFEGSTKLMAETIANELRVGNEIIATQDFEKTTKNKNVELAKRWAETLE